MQLLAPRDQLSDRCPELTHQCNRAASYDDARQRELHKLPASIASLNKLAMIDQVVKRHGGLSGFPDAIAAEYLDTQVQLCIVHMIRHSLWSLSLKTSLLRPKSQPF